jgi:hypothetical protein
LSVVSKCFYNVLNADEDLAAMYLSDKKNDVTRAREDHEDLEVLLESFAKQVEEIVNEADTMIACTCLPSPPVSLPPNLCVFQLEQHPIDPGNRRAYS